MALLYIYVYIEQRNTYLRMAKRYPDFVGKASQTLNFIPRVVSEIPTSGHVLLRCDVTRIGYMWRSLGTVLPLVFAFT